MRRHLVSSVLSLRHRSLGVSAGGRRFSTLAEAVTPSSSLALIAPQQKVSLTYEQLDLKVRGLAQGLEELGYGKGSVCISDVPNTAENLILQLALSHLGACLCTPPKDPAKLSSLLSSHDVKGAVTLAPSPPPGLPPLPLPLVTLSEDPAGAIPFSQVSSAPPRTAAPAAAPSSLLGIYGGAELTHSTAVELGQAAARRLSVTHTDRVCVSVTLCHAFGIGSASASALVSGAAVVLPAVGGIRGCGDPNQRAEVTLHVLQETQATLLFADTHTLKALPPSDTAPPSLRGGVCKIGSGSSFLEGVSEAPGKDGAAGTPLSYGGVAFVAMGKQ